MIVVTGSARTGTSLMVRTLMNLGFSCPSQAFEPEHDELRHMNPEGFYELIDEGLEGIQHDGYRGQVVKLFSAGLKNTPAEYIDKIIVCCRDMDEASKSYIPALESLHPDYATKDWADKIYQKNYRNIQLYLRETGIRALFVDLSNMRENPQNMLATLIRFLKINPSVDQQYAALNHIRPLSSDELAKSFL